MTTPLYSTTDIDLAAFLVCKQHELMRIEMQGTRGFFVFGRTTALELDVADWMNEAGAPMVSAKLYAKKRTSLYRRVRDLVRATGKEAR